MLKNNWRGEGRGWASGRDKERKRRVKEKRKKENRNKRFDAICDGRKKFHSDIILYKRIKKKKKVSRAFCQAFARARDIFSVLNIDVLEKRRKRKNVGDYCFVCKQPIVIIHNYKLIILTINYSSPDHRHHRYYYYIIDVSVDKKKKKRNKVYVVECSVYLCHPSFELFFFARRLSFFIFFDLFIFIDPI